MSEKTVSPPAFGSIVADAARAVASLDRIAPAFEEAAALVVGALRDGRKVLAAGNGGSAAEAMHLAEELSGRYHADRRALPGLALCADGTALTCIGNDFGFERVFARQVEALGRPGDVLYAISTSGNSPNVVAAVETARRLGIKTVAVTGAGGGRLKELCDLALSVPATKANHIQELHIALGHLLCGLAERALNG